MPRFFKEVPKSIYAEFVKYHIEFNHARDNPVEATSMSVMQTYIEGAVIAQAVYTKNDGQPVNRKYEIRCLEPKDVRATIEKIIELSEHDSEAASSMEHGLVYDVLFAIKHEAVSEPAKCVAMVLEVRSLHFSRY